MPDDSKEQAVLSLISALEEGHMIVQAMINAVAYASKAWGDDDYEVYEPYEKSKVTGNIELGCFVSELSMES